jgi:hypothetical protein
VLTRNGGTTTVSGSGKIICSGAVTIDTLGLAKAVADIQGKAFSASAINIAGQ